MDNLSLINPDIENRIYTLRGVQVMLDEDLADLYGVQTKVLNQAVKRNGERFPAEFMFQLTKDEMRILRSQNATSTTWGGRRYPPYAFTEQGVAMLSAVLRSKTAVKVSVQIMKAFVAMRRFVLTNAQIFQRLESLELRQIETDKRVDEIMSALERKASLPDQGIFYDGQVFDAWRFVSDLVRSAERSIILIDNYIDDSVFSLFAKRAESVEVTILTRNIPKELKTDIQKFHQQYPRIAVRKLDTVHDRFLIIDETDLYHFGASLKDLGKKWFAFTKMQMGALDVLRKLREEKVI
jgi:phage regulator Rha-like protein